MERVKRKEKMRKEWPVSDRHECWPKVLGLTAQSNIAQRKRTCRREGPEIRDTYIAKRFEARYLKPMGIKR